MRAKSYHESDTQIFELSKLPALSQSPSPLPLPSSSTMESTEGIARKHYQVLVVDDNHMNQHLLQAMLLRLGLTFLNWNFTFHFLGFGRTMLLIMHWMVRRQCRSAMKLTILSSSWTYTCPTWMALKQHIKFVKWKSKRRESDHAFVQSQQQL